MSEDDRVDLSGLRTVAHPLRLRLLSLLTGRTMSAAEAARELGRVVHEAAERTSDGGTVRVSLTVAAFESE